MKSISIELKNRKDASNFDGVYYIKYDYATNILVTLRTGQKSLLCNRRSLLCNRRSINKAGHKDFENMLQNSVELLHRIGIEYNYIEIK